MKARGVTSDFVQDYAAKRQAQMDRAKALREERRHQTANQPYTANPAPSHGGYGGGAEPVGTAPASASKRGKVLHIMEEDFKAATQSGIITPDQARQLWAMLSNQIIRVGRESDSNTVSVNALLALSNGNNHNSAGRGRGGGGRGAFASCVSLDALRRSIAEFKAEQRGGVRPSSGSSSSVAMAYRGATPTGHVSDGDHRPAANHHNRYNENVHDDYAEDEDTEDDYAPPPPAKTLAKTNKPQVSGAKKAAFKKPQWNDDVEVDERAIGNSNRVAQREREEVPPPRKEAPAKKSTTSKPATTKKPPPQSFDDMPISSGGYANVDDIPLKRPGGGAQRPGSAIGPSLNNEIEAEAAAVRNEPQRPCRHCQRSFRESVLVRHEKLCQRQSNQPKQVFDAKEMRISNIEAGHNDVQVILAAAKTPPRKRPGGGAQQAGKKRGNADAGKALPKWKIEHEQLQAAMKAIREFDQQKAQHGSGPLPPPPALPDEFDNRVLCPHCGRKFAAVAAERHIPHCANTKAKPNGIRPLRR